MADEDAVYVVLVGIDGHSHQIDDDGITTGIDRTATNTGRGRGIENVCGGDRRVHLNDVDDRA